MTQPAYELALGEVGDHVAELRRAAEQGDVVYLTEHGERLAAVIPLHRPTPRSVAPGRLAAVVGPLSDFERFVDVETSRDGWDGQ